MASHAIPRTAAGVCRNGGRDLPDALSTKQRESTMRESRSLTEHRRIGMSGVRVRGEDVSDNRGRPFQSGPSPNERVVVSDTEKHGLLPGLLPSTVYPKPKQRACFFVTLCNQSAFQPVGLVYRATGR